MKRQFITLLCAVCVLAASAQTNPRYMRITKTDGAITEFAVEDIDSIDFYTKITTVPDTPIDTVNQTINGHKYVDLGLPTGLLWATCNIGATYPEEYGDYFAWGETTTKSEYTESNYTYSGNPTTLPLSADAANANWGGNWRMPTKEERDELFNNCIIIWTDNYNYTGIAGFIFKNKVAGSKNIIFLPAGGRYQASLSAVNLMGNYWCSSFDNGAQYFSISSSGGGLGKSADYLGYSVRAVCSPVRK